MRTVYKFELKRVGVTNLLLPVAARIMRIDIQASRIYAWIALDTDDPYIAPFAFVIVGTGDEIPEGFTARATFFEGSGWFVWHACVRYASSPQLEGKPGRTLGEMELMNG